MVVMAAKRLEELNEIRTKSDEELNEEILQLKGELFMLRLQRSAREDFKPSEFGRMRKRVILILLNLNFLFFVLKFFILVCGLFLFCM